MTLVIDKLIRYEDRGDVVLKEEYPILKFTPQGAWIDVWGKKKFVLARTFKKFAAKTDEEARKSFFARKHRQLRILEHRIEGIKDAIQALKDDRIADYSGSRWFE